MSRRLSLALLMLMAIVHAAGFAAEEPLPRRRRVRPPVSPSTPPAPKKEEEEKKGEKDRFLAIVGGHVHTMTGPVLENTTILCKNGKIDAIGNDLQIPKDAQRIDAAGLDVYPGLIASGSNFSLVEAAHRKTAPTSTVCK